LDQGAVSTGVSRRDTVSAAGRLSAPTTRYDLHTTAKVRGSAIDRAYAVRTTRALLGV